MVNRKFKNGVTEVFRKAFYVYDAAKEDHMKFVENTIKEIRAASDLISIPYKSKFAREKDYVVVVKKKRVPGM